jgi:hypothetical protein
MGSLEPELGPPLIKDPRSFEGLYHEILNEPEEAQVLEAGSSGWTPTEAPSRTTATAAGTELFTSRACPGRAFG